MKVRQCRYPECAHTKAFGCKLHLLPADHYKCRHWMRLCKFEGTPRQLPGRIQICSCHFVGQQGPTKENPHPIPYEVYFRLLDSVHTLEICCICPVNMISVLSHSLQKMRVGCSSGKPSRRMSLRVLILSFLRMIITLTLMIMMATLLL